MKYLLFLFSFTTLAFACESAPKEGVQEIRTGPNADLIRNPISADQPLDTTQLARIVFKESEFDFGEVTEGDIVEHKYAFTNTGTVPLTIKDARSSCGCTTPDWPKETIPPGGTGFISAKFNTDGRTDKQSKLVIVTANTYPNETRVKLKGFVKPK